MCSSTAKDVLFWFGYHEFPVLDIGGLLLEGFFSDCSKWVKVSLLLRRGQYAIERQEIENYSHSRE